MRNVTQKIMPLSVSLLALVLITTIPTESIAQKKSGWGAAPLAEKFRPARTWINNFSTTADVIATGSIADAIDSCDDVVGENRYCVVEVTNTSTGIPLEIYRSKTKLIGVEDMTPLTSTENAIYIYIGDNTKQVIIENLNLQGHVVGNDEIYGIVVEGKNIRKILIRNNKIHHFDSDSDAHGIAVYGTGKNWRQSIRNVIIEGNEVYYCASYRVYPHFVKGSGNISSIVWAKGLAGVGWWHCSCYGCGHCCRRGV